MDPYSGAAYGRIRLFLADLNLVLGTSLPASPYGPLGGLQPSFNHIGLPPQFNHGGFQQSLPWNRPTKRSRAWKMNARGSQSARRPPYAASRREYVSCHPKSRVHHQSIIHPNNLRLDHHKPSNGVQTTFPALSDRDTGSHNCQPDNEPDQNPSEAPENEDVDGESKNEPDAENDSTECLASPADTVEDPDEPDKNSSELDAINHDRQSDNQSDLLIELGPEAGSPTSFHPVTAPDMTPTDSCSGDNHSDIVIGMSPTAQNPSQNYNDQPSPLVDSSTDSSEPASSQLISTSAHEMNPELAALDCSLEGDDRPEPVPSSFQPVPPIPYLHVHSPCHHFPVPYPHLMPFYPENPTQSPCQANTRSLQQNCQPVHDPGLNQIPPATVHEFTNPSEFPPPIHAPTPHFSIFPAPPTHFHHQYQRPATPHHQYPQPETPHHQHPLPCPPSPDVVNNNIHHNQQSNYTGVINNILQEYPELCLDNLNLETSIPYPNHQDYNIDEYQQQHYEYEDHQDAPNDQFDYHQDDSADYDNGGDDYNYDDGGYNYDHNDYYDDYN